MHRWQPPHRTATRTIFAVLLVACGATASVALDDPVRTVTEPAPPFPVDELLSYKVSWMGLRCGTMTLESFAEPGDDGTTYRIVMTARSSKFFDGVYRVRSRIDSWFSGADMSSIRYHYVSEEKKKSQDDLYEFDLDAGQIRRTKNGEHSEFAIEGDHVHDPLAYLYRLRLLAGESGDQMSLVLATTKGALDTTATVVERKRIKTRFGRQEALRVVPEPKDGMLFSKSGRMAVWVGADERALPYRVIFDLSFGKLVAKLIKIEQRGAVPSESGGSATPDSCLVTPSDADADSDADAGTRPGSGSGPGSGGAEVGESPADTVTGS
jgi:hypothetical protein